MKYGIKLQSFLLEPLLVKKKRRLEVI